MVKNKRIKNKRKLNKRKEKDGKILMKQDKINLH